MTTFSLSRRVPLPGRAVFACCTAGRCALAGVASVMVLAAAVAPAQDSSTVSRSRLGVLPILGSAPETGFQYGATTFRVYRSGTDSSTRPSVDQLVVSYTAEQQLKASLQTERWLEGNTWRLRGRVEYEDYPLPFYGVGPSTPTDAEEWYAARGPALHLQAQRRVRPATYVMGGLRFAHNRISDLEPSGKLATQTVTGWEGGTVSQLQAGLLRDSRDHIFAPRSGTFAQAVVSLSSSALGADYQFTRTDIDIRQYAALGRLVLAGQVQYARGGGTVPFDQLPSIGADTALRGYPRGRFRDRHLLSGQVELRTPRWRRLGAVVFAGAGTVASQASDLTRNTWQPSVGGGMRFVLFPREGNAIRVDFAKGRGSSGLYIGLNEAF